jgi:hypothetical protein
MAAMQSYQGIVKCHFLRDVEILLRKAAPQRK